jgi:hypothetical protein
VRPRRGGNGRSDVCRPACTFGLNADCTFLVQYAAIAAVPPMVNSPKDGSRRSGRRKQVLLKALAPGIVGVGTAKDMRHSLLRETHVTVEKQQWLKQMEGILEMLNEGVIIGDECGRILTNVWSAFLECRVPS